MDKLDAIVIGAGVVGLAVAASLSRRFGNVLIIDRAETIGTGISSRNSEVIHAGIYYPTGSLKAQLCVEGKRQLYAYCRRRGVAVNSLGKLIVATQVEQEAQLDALFTQARANGVDDLNPLGRRQLQALEPALKASAGLLSPSTGIVDSHGLMLSLLAEAEEYGAIFCPHTEFITTQADANGFRVELMQQGERVSLETSFLINCAGLFATEVATRIEGLAESLVPQLYWCKGHYFAYQGKSPFAHLIYPVPEPGLKGLGIHATIDLGGQLKFGPDAQYMVPDSLEDYRVPEALRQRFHQAIASYYPGIAIERLQTAYAGIRPKLQGPDDTEVADFLIQGEAQHGIPGLVNLLGIESPGLTASLAIAEQVSRQLVTP
ncbi:NAD(P)/FAD-dependent oxidoreductase [Shewanella loihica]|uniref:FAD dependent oxidoreductase n=1 Tax=Shewanella loihica (strain ATCC BAA-1088 / PV-4) TaxID=323850 RepID=A3QAA4_SHELP|nr:NAD(P)/FAD-dependent oxidoreductase [Shewanella loihica]ABO22402.1 FAD dependent oxidoreductase [Shewanella loihica PV-4]